MRRQTMSEKLSQQEIEALLRADEASEEPEAAHSPAEETKTGSPEPRVDVKQVQFQSFDEEGTAPAPENIGLILDIPMQVTVELGRAKKNVEDILKLGTGSVIELDKLAGEPVDILVNGKPIARGEVVVIDENFGVRVSDIISSSHRIPRQDDHS
jgi:flagellar motor switch protein FliN/FliY